MGVGLGKNSPVVLSLGKGNFEALVDRHGQWLRWRTAKKCPRVTEHNAHDIHCPKCGGSGYLYDYQRSYDDVFRAAVRDGIIELPETASAVLGVYDLAGARFQFSRIGGFARITGPRIPNRGEFVDVRFRENIVKRMEAVTLENAGGGYWRVPGLLTAPSKLEGVFYQAAGDVIDAEGLRDGDGNPVAILGFRRDMILTGFSGSRPLTAASVDYVMPFKFIVLSQNLAKADAALVDAHKGEAVCTFPYIYNVSEGDVLTVLSGAQTRKIVMEKRGGNFDDTIQEYFVDRVDSIETESAAYTEGVDFALVGTNAIHWTGNRPGAGEMMAITCRYHPTYQVTREIPMLRTSEDQRIPRKVVLGLFSAFSEAKKVNRND
jgi:hypothetical protein